MVKAEVGRKSPGLPVSSLLWEQKRQQFVVSTGSVRQPPRVSQSPDLAKNGSMFPNAKEGCAHGTTSQWTSKGLEVGNEGRQDGDRNGQRPEENQAGSVGTRKKGHSGKMIPMWRQHKMAE